MEVLALGDNCIDVYVEQGMGYPGGGAVNTAVYLSRAGVEVAYAGAVGNDPSGRLLLRAMNEEGIDASWVEILPGVTDLAFVRHTNGDRGFLGTRPGVRSQFRWQRIPMSVYESARVVHTTVDGTANELLPHLRGRVTVTYDFSRKFTPAHENLLPCLDVAFASAAHLTERQALDLAQHWLARGSHTVVLTRGDRGSLAVTQDAVFSCGIREVSVIDTLGAGDAFIAGYIHGLLRNESVQSCLERGRDLSARVLQRLGAFGHGVSLDILGIAEEALVWKQG